MNIYKSNATPDSAGAGDVKPCFELRAAGDADFGFTQTLYLSSMKPLLKSLGAWDEPTVLANFKDYFNANEIRIIKVDGRDVGWIQVSETDDELHLDQIHLNDDVLGKGIGTILIKSTMADALAKGKPVLLSLIRGNRALGLYEKLGFRLVDSDPVKLYMRWDCD